MASARQQNLCLALVFWLLLAAPVTMQWLSGQVPDVRTSEQRTLAPFPSLPAGLNQIHAWPATLEDWFDDRFGFRAQLLKGHNAVFSLLGVSPNKKAIIGRDGWLFINQTRLLDANRGAFPFARGELAALTRMFESRQEALQALGVTYIHVTSPDKQSVYPEYLPARVKQIGPSRYRQFTAALKDSNVNFVDLYSPLMAARARKEKIYFQTDSHWTCRGAFIAYRAIMTAVGQTFSTGFRTLDDVDIEFRFAPTSSGFDLAQNVLGVPGLYPDENAGRCKARHPSTLTYSEMASGRLVGFHDTANARGRWLVRNSNPDLSLRLLAFRDSYANGMMNFLNESFAEVIYAHHGALSFDMDLVGRLKPDIVLYEHVERTLAYSRRALERERQRQGKDARPSSSESPRRPRQGLP